jgi:hypothetical protein
LLKDCQMSNDTEKQKKNRKGTGTGAHLIGEKKGNNLALETSVQPSPESKSNGWAIRNRLLQGAKEIAEFAESTKSGTVLIDGQEVEMSMLAHAYYKQLKRAIEKDDTRAFLAYIQATEGFTSKHAMIGENGNVVNPPIIVFSHSKEELLKDLGVNG